MTFKLYPLVVSIKSRSDTRFIVETSEPTWYNVFPDQLLNIRLDIL